MDMARIAASGFTSGMPSDYTMILMRKAMNTEEKSAARELNLLPRLPQIPAVPKGQFLDVYA